ncbi:hypothetical protein J6590_019820, partial [Homalodisca vitripennis]
ACKQIQELVALVRHVAQVSSCGYPATEIADIFNSYNSFTPPSLNSLLGTPLLMTSLPYHSWSTQPQTVQITSDSKLQTSSTSLVMFLLTVQKHEGTGSVFSEVLVNYRKRYRPDVISECTGWIPTVESAPPQLPLATALISDTTQEKTIRCSKQKWS